MGNGKNENGKDGKWEVWEMASGKDEKWEMERTGNGKNGKWGEWK